MNYKDIIGTFKANPGKGIKGQGHTGSRRPFWKGVRLLMSSFLVLVFLGFPGSIRAQTGRFDFIVSADGKGQFRTIQEAIDAVPDMRKKETVIFIRKGVYREKIVLAGSKTNVRLVGESRDSTVLYWDDYAAKKNRFGEEMGTSGSAGFYVYGDGFSAENLTFRNGAGPVGQAVAVFVAGDKVRFTGCRFLGFQDTLYTWGKESRQYYRNCYIEGTVDFIFGSSTAVFDSCTLFGKKGGYFTAASTPEHRAWGYVFRWCTLTGDGPDHSFMLGRPWRPFAKTVFLQCTIGKIVAPEGWSNWGKKENEATAFYAEWENRGAGAATGKRVPWARLLSAEAAKEYTLENILGDWNPEKKPDL